MTFTHVRPGDVVLRMLSGVVPMELTVAHVDETLIYCGAEYEAGEEYSGWTFDRESGFEVDPDLMWGPEFGRTGSYLIDN